MGKNIGPGGWAWGKILGHRKLYIRGGTGGLGVGEVFCQKPYFDIVTVGFEQPTPTGTFRGVHRW